MKNYTITLQNVMIRIIKSLIFNCIIFTILSLIAVHAQIKSRKAHDGTVEYYNTSPSSKTNSILSDLSKNPYDSIIINVCKIENIDPQLIRCIIKVESNFNKDAVSVAGAMGLMQLMQETAQAYGVQDPFDPEQNIKAGVKHFKSLLSFFKNDVILALAAYHAGLGVVKKNMAVPNIKSTITYVNDVMKLYQPGETHNYSAKVEKLYMNILPDGTINITNIK
ncbi:MAG: lytic transglycosylase domain-containing protein [Spirochaetes bacterium]|nr:lytic transglycosylase domain-containing protein [Spirochaetota bacterium]